MQAAACAASVTLTATLVRSGTVDAGPAVGLAFPTITVAPNGAAVITAVFSGPGRTPDDKSEAFPGVAAAFIDATARGAVPMSVVARGSAPVAASPAAGAGGAWGDLSAADVHPVTGAVYAAVRRGGTTRNGRAGVPTWVSVVPMAAAAAA